MNMIEFFKEDTKNSSKPESEKRINNQKKFNKESWK